MYIYIYTHIQERWWVSLGTLLELNKAPTVNFWGVTSCHLFEELHSSCPQVICKRGLAILVTEIAVLKYCDFARCLFKYRQIYYTNLLQKPGTNIDESDDFSWNRCLLG